MKKQCYIMVIGCGSLMYEAAVCSFQGSKLLTNFDAVSMYFEPVGRTLCGVTSYTSSTPAGSFFVPDVEVGGKSHKDLIRRRLYYARIGHISHLREKSCLGLETVHDRCTSHCFAENYQTSPSENYCSRNSTCLDGLTVGTFDKMFPRAKIDLTGTTAVISAPQNSGAVVGVNNGNVSADCLSSIMDKILSTEDLTAEEKVKVLKVLKK